MTNRRESDASRGRPASLDRKTRRINHFGGRGKGINFLTEGGLENSKESGRNLNKILRIWNEGRNSEGKAVPPGT
jgi:hypothetical protein